MSWNDRFRDEVPMPQRAQFLTDLQTLVSSVRVGRAPVVTPLLQQYPDLALAYLDDGDRKDRAARALHKA